MTFDLDLSCLKLAYILSRFLSPQAVVVAHGKFNPLYGGIQTCALEKVVDVFIYAVIWENPEYGAANSGFLVQPFPCVNIHRLF